MTSPSYVSGNSFANGLLNVTSATVTRPAGAANGDMLIAFIGIGHTGTITPPAGWLQPDLSEYGETSVLTLQTQFYFHPITNIGSEPADYTWTFASSPVSAVVEAWRDVGFIYLARQDADLLALLSHDTDTLNNQMEGAVPVCCFTGMSLLSLGWGPPSGHTERFDISGGLLALLNVNMSVSDGPSITTGPLSRTAATLSVVQGLAALVLLAPVTVGISLASVPLAAGMDQSSFVTSFLVTEEKNSQLNLDACIGQRQATFRFDHIDIVTGYRKTLHPIRDTVPVLSHDTSRTITRTISGLRFNAAETAELSVISARIEVFMLIAGQEFPLGQYVFNDQTRFRYTSGVPSSTSLYDLGFIVDQPIEESFPFFNAGISVTPAEVLITDLLDNLPIVFTIEPSPYQSVGSWTAGTRRGTILEQLAIDGDWFSPWFDNTNVLRFIRSFDPATALVTFDFDTGSKVMQEPPPVETDDLLTAPNRFIVISNSANGLTSPAVGTYDIPSSAPHSAANRGFIVSAVFDRQLTNTAQAGAVAQNLGLRQTIFERAEIFTAPDPRHDSYDVIRWQGENWLEIAWSLPLIEGSVMRHTIRKAYTP